MSESFHRSSKDVLVRKREGSGRSETDVHPWAWITGRLRLGGCDRPDPTRMLGSAFSANNSQPEVTGNQRGNRNSFRSGRDTPRRPHVGVETTAFFHQAFLRTRQENRRDRENCSSPLPLTSNLAEDDARRVGLGERARPEPAAADMAAVDLPRNGLLMLRGTDGFAGSSLENPGEGSPHVVGGRRWRPVYLHLWAGD